MVTPSSISLSKKLPRLLVVDEALALGGVETLWLALLPELSKLCEVVAWMLPAHRISAFSDTLSNDSGLLYESFNWPYWNTFKLKSAFLKRAALFLTPISLVYRNKIDNFLLNERLEFVIRKHRITHVLYPALFNQPFPVVSVPVFATVHDVNYHPSWCSTCISNLLDWSIKADTLLTDSCFTKDQVEKICGSATAKIVAIPLASNLAPKSQVESINGDSLALYYPASFNPHKGHILLLKSLLKLHLQGIDFSLILTGTGTQSLHSEESLVLPELEEARQFYLTAPVSFRQKIDVRGRVSVAAVEVCFACSNIVVLPSSYEGFGLPLAEAVARNKRVICADIPAFREQVALYGFAEAVTFVSEPSTSAWASAIQTALLQRFNSSPYSYDRLQSIFARRSWQTVALDYVNALSK
jgi:glycosyltransferase involved in cell wall biosynthesis